MHLERLRRSWNDWITDADTPRAWWVDIAWTLAFCAAVAVGFTILNVAGAARRNDPTALATWWSAYRTNLGISVVIGALIHLGFTLGQALLGRPRIRAFGRFGRTLYYGAIPLTGAFIGWPLGISLMTDIDLGKMFGGMSRNALIGFFLMFCLIGALCYNWFALKSRQIEADRRAAEAQLRLLQAQIEPHFLFNTLANVVSLMDAHPARARAMLESFVDYLRASLSGFGRDRHTLGDELALIDAYLRIVQTRMEDRLAYRISVPEALRERRVPPLSIQPLVENAVVHGIEPSVAGGRIEVGARLVGTQLAISVEDDGVGLAAEPGPRAAGNAGGPGSGTALANIRARLRETHPGRSGLAVAPRAPRGTLATLTLPADDTPARAPR